MASALPEIAAGVGAAGLAIGGFRYASLWPTSQIFGRTLIAGNDPSEIALTFDDGPNDTATPMLLELLARHNVQATFFCIGSFARLQPKLVREIVAAGHRLGNHTMTHPRLSLQSGARVRRELADCNALLEDLTGVAVRYFRPPFGARRPVVLRAARELDLTPVMWNVTGFDWLPIGAEVILRNLEDGLARNRQRRRRASNLLLHDGGYSAMGIPRIDTVNAVARLLEAHQNEDLRYVTVDAWTVTPVQPVPTTPSPLS
jgi:peptidoglycan/xylan/chitin deacetylase (PgdA/CDA1 family)